MKFKNEQHKNFYMENIQKTNSEHDHYRKALFYTLGLQNRQGYILMTFTILMKKCKL